MSEETTTQFNTEGQPAFPVTDTETEDSASSSEGEKTDGDQTQSQDGDKSGETKKDDTEGNDEKNLADHPRWKEREDDWTKRFNEQEKRHTDELTKIREDIEKRIGGNKTEDNASTEVPAWFGGDEAQWKDFQKWNTDALAKAKSEGKQETLTEIQKKGEEEQKRIDDATTYFNDQVKTIESDKTLNPQGTKVDRNKLLKFVLDNELVDTKGRWNYRAGFQMMKAGVTQAKNSSVDEKKQIAASTTNDKHTETQAPAFMTSADFSKPGNRPW